MTTVVVVAGAASGARVSVDRPLVVGRSEADLTIEDPQLSRRHAMLAPGPGGTVVVTDLGSTNGTWVNGTRVAGPATLAPGDRLRMGDAELVVEAVAAPPPPPLPPPAPLVGETPPRPRRPAATRLSTGVAATYAVVALDAAALLAYFAAR
jgi:pSer/pThr/pTyr-binding forkhead associated (FHA) protein